MLDRKLRSTLCAIAGLIGLVVAAPPAAAGGKNQIRGVAIADDHGTTTVRIEGSETPTFTVYKLERPTRVVIDVAQATLSEAVRGDEPSATFAVGSWAVSQVAAQAMEDGSTSVRVVVTLARPGRYDVKATGKDVVIAVTARDAAPKTVSAADVARAEADADRARKDATRLQADAERARKDATAAKDELAKNRAAAQAARAEAARMKAEAEAARAEAKAEAIKAQAAQATAERAQADAARASKQDRAAADQQVADAKAELARARATAAQAKADADQAQAQAKAAQIAADQQVADAKAAADAARADATRAQQLTTRDAQAARATAERELARAKAAQAAAEADARQARAAAEAAKADAAKAQSSSTKDAAAMRATAERDLARAKAAQAAADQAQAAAKAAQAAAEQEIARARAEAARAKTEGERDRAAAAEMKVQLERDRQAAARAQATADRAIAQARTELTKIEREARRAEEARAAARAAQAQADAREQAAKAALAAAAAERAAATDAVEAAAAARRQASGASGDVAAARAAADAKMKEAEQRLARADASRASAEDQRKAAEAAAARARKAAAAAQAEVAAAEQRRTDTQAAAERAEQRRAAAEHAREAEEQGVVDARARRTAEEQAAAKAKAARIAEEQAAAQARTARVTEEDASKAASRARADAEARRQAAAQAASALEVALASEQDAAEVARDRQRAAADADAAAKDAARRKASADEIATARAEAARLAKARTAADQALAARSREVARNRTEAARLAGERRAAQDEVERLKQAAAGARAARAREEARLAEVTKARTAEEQALVRLRADRAATAATPVRAPVAAAAPVPVAAPAKKSARIASVRFAPTDDQHSVVVDLEGRGASAELIKTGARKAELVIHGATLPAALAKTLDTSRFGGPVRTVSSYTDARGDVRVVVDLVTDATPRLDTSGGDVQLHFASAGVARVKTQSVPSPVVGGFGATSAPVTQSSVAQLGGKRKTYRGATIDLDFKEADIHDLLRLLSDVGRVSIVVPDEINAQVTVRMKRVPWDQALDVILASKGLGYRKEGNLYRIAPQKQLDAEDEAEAARLKAMIELEAPKPDVFTLNYASATLLKPKLEPLLSQRGSIEVDDRTNSIIVNDLARNRREVIDLAARLDTQTPQISIEARIVEARSSFERQIGIQWGGRALAGAAGGNATGLIFPSTIGVAGGSVDSQKPEGGVATPADFAINLPANGTQGAIGLTLGSVGGNVNINLRLSALEETGTVRIISAPKVTVLNNTRAEMKQGVKIPISIVSAQGTQTQFINANLSLIVTPYVSQRDCAIVMDVQVTKDEPDFVNTGARGDPTILNKEASTRMLVNDGETSVMGGIYTRNTGLSYSKIPFFGDLPVFGWLFKNRRENDDRAELLIFITPKITNKGALRCVAP